MNPDKLLELYLSMWRIRLVEEHIAELYPEKEIRCPVHLCIGQEAIAAGVCAVLRKDDCVMSGHRSHGHYLAKGGDLKRLLAEIYGKVTGCSRGKGGSMHLIDSEVGFMGSAPIVGSTIPIAVGVALGMSMQGHNGVGVSFFGEAATEEGVFAESLNFAALKSLPVIFVCENNLYSVYSPLKVRQPSARSICDIARAHGMEALKGDGNDFEFVMASAEEAVSRARRGMGPTLLEFSTYRWREHCGPNFDNQLGYRTEAEFLEWKDRCPIKRAENTLKALGIWTEQTVTAAQSAIRDELNAAVCFAKDSPFPEQDELMKHVFAKGT